MLHCTASQQHPPPPVDSRKSLTPITLVSSAIAHPSIPWKHSSKCQRPTSFNFGSLLHGPTGILYRLSTTFSNPASITYCFCRSRIRNVFPRVSPASMNTSDHCLKTWPSGIDPSSETHCTEHSTCSYQPPGLRCLRRSERRLDITGRDTGTPTGRLPRKRQANRVYSRTGRAHG